MDRKAAKIASGSESQLFHRWRGRFSPLKALSHCRHVALLTDGRFSGVSTGPCIGHIAPEALAGGPLGRLRDGDVIEIRIDREKLEGHVDLVGEAGEIFSAEEGARRLGKREMRADLQPRPDLPDDTRLWAALVEASGGIWGAACTTWMPSPKN